MLRRATLTDAPTLARLAEVTFRETFGAHNSAQDMDAHCGAYFGEDIQAAEIATQDHDTLVFESSATLVGFAQVRWGVVPQCVGDPSAGEIRRLYVSKAFHGAGVAQALMGGCLDLMAARGARHAWLGVWENNPRAIAFYMKHAFVDVGEHIFQLGNDLQRDLIMVRSLA